MEALTCKLRLGDKRGAPHAVLRRSPGDGFQELHHEGGRGIWYGKWAACNR